MHANCQPATVSAFNFNIRSNKLILTTKAWLMELDVNSAAEMQCQAGAPPSKRVFSHLFCTLLLRHLQCCRGTSEPRLFCACPPVLSQEREIKILTPQHVQGRLRWGCLPPRVRMVWLSGSAVLCSKTQAAAMNLIWYPWGTGTVLSALTPLESFFFFFLPWEASNTGASWFNRAPSAGAAQTHLLSDVWSKHQTQCWQIPCPHTLLRETHTLLVAFFVSHFQYRGCNSMLAFTLPVSILVSGDFLHQCDQNLTGSPWLFLGETAVSAEEYFACRVSSLQKWAPSHCPACRSTSLPISPY